MKQPKDVGIFKPSPSRSESRNEMTDRIFKEITSKEAAVTTAKTARLRAERLAREAEAAANPPPPQESKRPAAKRAKTVPAGS